MNGQYEYTNHPCQVHNLVQALDIFSFLHGLRINVSIKSTNLGRLYHYHRHTPNCQTIWNKPIAFFEYLFRKNRKKGGI